MSETKKRPLKTNQDINNNNVKSVNPESLTYHQLKVFQRYGFQRIAGEIFVPLLLMIIIPLVTMTLWHICRHHAGSISSFLMAPPSLYEITFGQWNNSFFSLYVISGYICYAVAVTLCLPGDTYNGPITDKGNTPVYVNNGFRFYLVTLALFIALSCFLEYIGYSITIICDRYGEFMLTLNLASLAFCVFLCIKGKYFPSSSDNGSSGNPIFDLYWGTELYPRIGKLDLKLLTNCRWGMMIWTLVVILFWIKSLKTYGFVDSHFVTMLLIVLYLTKFFWWEAGYMKTIDICVDRAGFYLCYGCLCFVPLFYALPSIYLAYHPVYLGWKLATFICLIGLLSLFVNYDADRQRYLARETNGKCLIWNKEPILIRAKFFLLGGKPSENLLLASGYWGLSRHFHYLPELSLAFCWCTTAAFQNLVPYLYFLFLTVLLFHRSIRDDTKCFNKYGKYWNDYKKIVPYKIIPFIY